MNQKKLRRIIVNTGWKSRRRNLKLLYPDGLRLIKLTTFKKRLIQPLKGLVFHYSIDSDSGVETKNFEITHERSGRRLGVDLFYGMKKCDV